MPPKDLQEKPGLGVVAIVDGKQAVLGRRALLLDLGIDAGSENGEAAMWRCWEQTCGVCLASSD